MHPQRLPILAAVGLLLVGGSALYALDARRAPEQVADLLDRLVQPRFQRDDEERFGMNRLVTLRGHENVSQFIRLNPAESTLLASAHALNRDYLVGFVRIPGSRPQPSAAKDPQPYLWMVSGRAVNTRDRNPKLAQVSRRRPELEKASLTLLPEAMSKGSARITAGDWHVTLRAVRAGKESCLGCHKESKRGDVLGVMVYAVGRQPL